MLKSDPTCPTTRSLRITENHKYMVEEELQQLDGAVTNLERQFQRIKAHLAQEKVRSTAQRPSLLAARTDPFPSRPPCPGCATWLRHATCSAST